MQMKVTPAVDVNEGDMVHVSEGDPVDVNEGDMVHVSEGDPVRCQ